MDFKILRKIRIKYFGKNPKSNFWLKYQVNANSPHANTQILVSIKMQIVTICLFSVAKLQADC